MATNTATGTTADGVVVTVQLEAAPVNPENVADIGVVFGLLLAAVVAVFCARRLLDLFTISPDEN